jgi:hypothetical protein
MSKGQPENSNLDDSAVMDSITSQWWSFSAFVPLLTGALWVWLASRSGPPAVLLGAVPGALLLGTGLSSLRGRANRRVAYVPSGSQKAIQSL